MPSGTRTGIETTTIAAGDIRSVMAQFSEEIAVICRAAEHVSPDFDVDGALPECSILAINDAVESFHVQFYLNDELVREYCYSIADARIEAYGPGSGSPPIGRIVDGARVRLVATPNRRRPVQYCEEWFRLLGWVDASPLEVPEGATYRTYGTFVSGGYGMERRLLVNPKFDAAVGSPTGPAMRKERYR